MTSNFVNPHLLEAGDELGADQAYRFLTQGGTLLWKGDFHNARQLLQAVARRIDRPRGRKVGNASTASAPTTPEERRQAFHKHRQQQAQRAALLNRILVPLTPSGQVDLRRAPDTREAVSAALLSHISDGAPETAVPDRIALRTVLGMLGAWEWQCKGVAVAGLQRPIHVRWGVFSPLRGEYLDLLWQAPLPEGTTACDVGTGSGVISITLAKRGLTQVVATDLNPAALLCARENVQLHGCDAHVQVLQADLFPAGQQFDLIVCNPPWLPAKPTSAIEQALYDPDHTMLKSFLQSVGKHLTPGGQVWLIMSDLAEHLGLRAPGFLQELISTCRLAVLQRHTAQPRHGKAIATTDPLHFARRAETTTLWRLCNAPDPQSYTLNQHAPSGH